MTSYDSAERSRGKQNQHMYFKIPHIDISRTFRGRGKEQLNV